MKDFEIAKKYINLADSAKKRNIEFDMSLTHVKKLLSQKKCYFTGEYFKGDLTIDRLDTKKGYTDTNTVACGSKFNQRKSNLSVREIELMYQGLKKKGLLS